MAILCILLIIILMGRLGAKGKAYREEKRQAAYRKRQHGIHLKQLEGTELSDEEVAQMKRDAREAEYRKDLEKQGYSEQLITQILPTLMNDGR